MKILRVIPSMNPVNGGPSEGIRNSIKQLALHGINTEVVSFDPPEYEGEGGELILHCIGPSVSPWHFTRKLKPWLNENLNRFDVVVVHGLWLYHSYEVGRHIRYLRQKGKKSPRVYLMPHGMLDPYFQKAPDRKLKAFRNSIYWALLERRLINNVDGLLFTSEEELLLAKKAFPGYSPKKEVVIGYGILSPPSADQILGLDKVPLAETLPDHYILYLSRIDKKKGVDDLVNAYLSLEASGANLPEMVIAGPGIDSKFGKEILDRASKSKRIHFPGMLAGVSKWSAFYLSRAFILPSHQENFGISVVEALSCSKIVLITNKINIWREIDSMGAGIVEIDNFEGAKSLLTRFGSLNQDEYQEMSANARACFEANFDLEQTVNRLIEVFFEGK